MRKRRKSNSKSARPHPLVFLSGVISGGVVLFFSLDIHFFHLFPNYPVGVNHPIWIVMSALGVLMIIVSIRNMINTPSLTRMEDDFDPSVINDPIAEQTEWTPIQGGANFCTHRLVKVGENRMEFRPTRETRMFDLSLIISGSIAFLVLFVGLVSGRINLPPSKINSVAAVTPFMVVTAVIAGFGFYGRYCSKRPIVFDRTLELSWKGTGPAQGVIPWQHSIRFNDIHALQLVSQYHPSESGMRGSRGTPSYYSYELIVVLNDAARIGVVHHGGRKELLEDAMTLSQFLDRPLWNGISDE